MSRWYVWFFLLFLGFSKKRDVVRRLLFLPIPHNSTIIPPLQSNINTLVFFFYNPIILNTLSTLCFSLLIFTVQTLLYFVLSVLSILLSRSSFLLTINYTLCGWGRTGFTMFVFPGGLPTPVLLSLLEPSAVVPPLGFFPRPFPTNFLVGLRKFTPL